MQNTLPSTIQEETLEVLKLAACLGNREFNTSILSSVVGLPAEEVNCYLTSLTSKITQRLWPAVIAGLIGINDEQMKV